MEIDRTSILPILALQSKNRAITFCSPMGGIGIVYRGSNYGPNLTQSSNL